jgi:hypothetical protein
MLLALSSCAPNKAEQERIKWQITLASNDKRPYGTYLAASTIKYAFPTAVLEPLSPGFRYDNMDSKMKHNEDGRSLIIFCGLDFKLSDEEWKNLKQFINNGNEVMIFCSSLDEKIEKDLSCYKDPDIAISGTFYNAQPDLHNKDILQMASIPGRRFGYEGRSIKGYFSVEIDSSDITNKTDASDDNDDDMRIYVPDTLGYASEMPDMLRYRIGDGHLTLHAAPLVLSNYFLLQTGNIDYLNALWQTLPKNINKIYTDNYYKRSASKSGLSVLWKYPATRWALLLALFLLLMYVLFEGKRKQRIIPIVAPLKNDSVSFVETVGRLYYNKGNHTNLADKMVQQFLEWVRTHYLLNTNLLNENFLHQLTIKSGQPEATVRETMEMIHEIRLRSVKIDDPYLYKLYNTIQLFYKNNHT